jgi:MoxR-like ATPase
VQQFEWVRQRCDELIANVEQVIHGKTQVVSLAVVCLLAEGHLLIEDVPGVAKTSLAKAIAQSVGGAMKRIQFTPDLLPSDVTGVRIYDAASREFQFRHGPVFANIVLGDEINRASPKTQSALLEAMGEHQVTVDGDVYWPPLPHFLVATQNPIDHQGTYPLPEAQLDRFLMMLRMGYPSFDHELRIVDDAVHRRVPEMLEQVLSIDDVQRMIELVRQVRVVPQMRGYIVSITSRTRVPPMVDRLRLGASPRASNALAVAGQAHAARLGRSFVTADDVKAVAHPVLDHRLLLTAKAEIQGDTAAGIVDDVLADVRVPWDVAGV